jgi:hypothetical protein
MNASELSARQSVSGQAEAHGETPVIFSTLTHYGAVDWARGHHDLCVVDAAGAIAFELRIDDTPEGWANVRERIAVLKTSDGSPATVGFAIETSSGPAVERLLEANLPVFPLNPKAAERYRDRKAPTGIKSDRLDAYCFADALRTDGHGWRPLHPQDALTHELRLLCRDEITLISQRTALVNQLQAALNEYYPTALAAFDDWTAGAPGSSSSLFPRRINWPAPANANTRNSSTPTSSIAPKPARSVWNSSAPPIAPPAPIPPSPPPKACWRLAWQSNCEYCKCN